MDDPALTAAGDFAAFYEEARPRLVTALRSDGTSREHAADAADEALTRALERWERVGAMASPLGWTYITGRNVARRRLRRTRLERMLLRRDPRPPGHIDADPLVDFVSVVEALPAPQRDVLICRHVLMLSEPEISAVLSVPRGTVSSRLRRAHERLRSELDAGPSVAPTARSLEGPPT